MQLKRPTFYSRALLALMLLLVALGAPGLLGRVQALAPADRLASLAYAQGGRVWWIATEGQPHALPLTGYAAEAALAPDGRRLAYLLTPDSALGQAPLPAQLWLADLSDGASTLLADDLILRAQLAWSPDSARLALAERDALVVYDAVSGARKVAAQHLATAGPSFADYAWSPDGAGLICLTQDDAGRQWVEWAAGTAGAGRAPVPGNERATAVALSPGGQAATLLLESGTLVELQSDGGALTPLTSVPEPVVAFAWSPAGAQLVVAAADGRLWLAARGVSSLEAGEPLAALAAPVLRLNWNTAGQVETILAVRGGHAAALVTPFSGAVRVAGLAPLAAAQVAPLEPPLLSEVSAPYDWYRAQGDSDSGACASTNCGPTSVAMAIEFARDELTVPISQIRTYMTGSDPCGDGTNGDQLRAALTNWSVPFTRISGLQAVSDAINLRGHIVIVPVIMADIAPGVDYNTASTSPANVWGRYYTFTGGHWLVVRGISADGQWVQVYDPNVWPPVGGRYYYSNNMAKGRDRLYRTSEFATAFANNGNWAMEITAVPSDTLLPPTGLLATDGLYADRVAVTWTPSVGATYYSVHRSDSPAGAKLLLGFPAQASWEDYDVAPDTPGYYWVTACNTDGCSDYAGPEAGHRNTLDLPARAWLPTAIAGW